MSVTGDVLCVSLAWRLPLRARAVIGSSSSSSSPPALTAGWWSKKLPSIPESRRASNGRSSPSMQRGACICNRDFSGAGTVLSFRLISTPTANDEQDLLVKLDSEQDSYWAYYSTSTSQIESCEDALLA